MIKKDLQVIYENIYANSTLFFITDQKRSQNGQAATETKILAGVL
jgi:hypothetical protein